LKANIKERLIMKPDIKLAVAVTDNGLGMHMNLNKANIMDRRVFK
jgi:hypothetical protein